VPCAHQCGNEAQIIDGLVQGTRQLARQSYAATVNIIFGKMFLTITQNGKIAQHLILLTE
jgi:hypothetical protein